MSESSIEKNQPSESIVAIQEALTILEEQSAAVKALKKIGKYMSKIESDSQLKDVVAAMDSSMGEHPDVKLYGDLNELLGRLKKD